MTHLIIVSALRHVLLWMDFFSVFGINVHQHEVVCCAQWPLTLTYIFNVIQSWLCKAIKLLKYGTSWGGVHFTGRRILDGSFPDLAQMITVMKGCVTHNDLWPYPISFVGDYHSFRMRAKVVFFTLSDFKWSFLTITLTISSRSCSQ